MSRMAVGTIVAKNFLSFARVLAASVREHHPETRFFVVLADQVDEHFDPAAEPFDVLSLPEIAIDGLRRACFWYQRAELSIIAKPYLLSHLLNCGYEGAVFIDADILVLGTLDPLFQATAAHAIVLTPHLVDRLAGPDRVARELNILQSGIYNGGCIGVSSKPGSRRFLAWWKDRLRKHCRHAPGEGMHYDQRWLDLVPTLFDDVHIERDASCNVAHWNLPERDSQASPRFFHFSGFEPANPQAVTRYSERLSMGTIGRSAPLFDRYVHLLGAQGYDVTRHWPYAFDLFDNGVPIPRTARDLYRQLSDDEADAFGDPFCTRGTHSFYRWLNDPVCAGQRDNPVTQLWDAVYRKRPDVQLAFPDHLGADRSGFVNWTVTSGLREHQIDDAFTSPA